MRPSPTRSISAAIDLPSYTGSVSIPSSRAQRRIASSVFASGTPYRPACHSSSSTISPSSSSRPSSIASAVRRAMRAICARVCSTVAEPSIPSTRRARRDRVGRSAGGAHRVERLLPARPERDVEARVDEAHIGAHQPREEDVADLVVDRVGPVDPMLLHEHALQAEPRGDSRDLSRVVRLHAADRDERVAALRQRVRGEVLELAYLVAAERQTGVAILALRPDVDATAEVLAEPLETVHG